jgi:hypothetical protein
VKRDSNSRRTRPPRSAIAGAAAASIIAVALSFGCRQREADPSEATPVLPTSNAGSDRAGSTASVAGIVFGEPLAAHTARAIEVSTLSRVNRTSARERPSIDLRLDATDGAGAPARLAGNLRVVVVAPGSDPETLVFEFPLRTLADANRRYDATLEQYLVRVEPSWGTPPAVGSALEISVRLMPPSGEPLEAVGRIDW